MADVCYCIKFLLRFFVRGFIDNCILMRSNFQLLLLLCIVVINANAQNNQLPSLKIGDPAPPLRVREWIKGTPVQTLEKGKVYVVEFWATWCKPCIAAMPHLSSLARQYKDNITILGIDIMERETTTMEQIRAFVDSVGSRMDYHIAAEDSNFMAAGWLKASGEQTIPSTFVVDAVGRLAWIGHPKDLAEVLDKIVNNRWDFNHALTRREQNNRLQEFDQEAIDTLLYMYLDNPGKQDSTLLVIDQMVRNNPQLKYASLVGATTFSLLLQKDPQKAYEFGKVMLVTPTYEDPPYDHIASAIEYHSAKLNFPPKIWELGAEAYQRQIAKYPWNTATPNTYHKMAALFWRAKNKSKAIDAEQKAIELLKSNKTFSRTDLATFESQLQQYKKM